MTAHKRIRPFNTKQTYPEQKLDNDLCQAVVARGTMVFLRGQVAQDLDTRESLHVGDATAQTAKTMANIKLLMEESGGSLDHICRIVVYLTDMRYREAVYRARRALPMWRDRRPDLYRAIAMEMDALPGPDGRDDR